jgi:hypothetical protein
MLYDGTTHCSTDVDPAGDVVPSGHGVHHGLTASLNCSRVTSYVFAGHGDAKPVPLNIFVACDDTDVFVSIVFRNVPGTYDVVVVPSVNPFNPLQFWNVF